MLENKIVLITGSSRGIGKAIAYAFAEKKYTVILNSNSNETQLIETYNEFIDKGFKCYYIKADVSKYNEVTDMIAKIYNLFGKIDILINNAGISYVGLFTDMTYDDWNSIINTNVNSLFNCCINIIPDMVSSKSGCIINISSMWGISGASCEVAYSASKGAVNSFTKALAKELGPSNIRVNAIACGVINTDMNNWLSLDEELLLKNEIALMRFGTVEEVAKLALFLASEDSSFITGQIISIDGG